MPYDYYDYGYIYDHPGSGQFFPGGNQGGNWQNAFKEYTAYAGYKTILGRTPTIEQFEGVAQIFKSSGGDVAGYSYLQGLKLEEETKAKEEFDAGEALKLATVEAEREKTAQTFASTYGFAAPTSTKGGTPTSGAASSPFAAAASERSGWAILILAAAVIYFVWFNK